MILMSINLPVAKEVQLKILIIRNHKKAVKNLAKAKTKAKKGINMIKN